VRTRAWSWAILVESLLPWLLTNRITAVRTRVRNWNSLSQLVIYPEFDVIPHRWGVTAQICTFWRCHNFCFIFCPKSVCRMTSSTGYSPRFTCSIVIIPSDHCVHTHYVNKTPVWFTMKVLTTHIHIVVYWLSAVISYSIVIKFIQAYLLVLILCSIVFSVVWVFLIVWNCIWYD